MDGTDAEEYTQALGQIGSGWWRQIALGQRLGVPAALGLTTDEWVTSRLGGYIRLSIPERREAAKELVAPVDEGGQGMSAREAAAILGVSNTTVSSDLRSVKNLTDVSDEVSESAASPVKDCTPPSELVCESCGTPTLPLWVDADDQFGGALLCGRCAERRDADDRPVPKPETEPETEPALPPRVDGRRAWNVFLSLSELRDVDVAELVEALPDDRLEHVEPVVDALLGWLPRVTEEVRRRSSRLPVGLRKERILRGKDELWLSPA